MSGDNSSRNSIERRIDERLTPLEMGLPVELTSLLPGRRSLKGELVNVSSGGLAVWLPKLLDQGSHWLLSMPDLEGAGVPIKMLSARPGFGGHIHGFKFSTHQATLADRLARAQSKKGRKQ